MSDSFGTRLRRRREEQGIPLVRIAQDTKIKLSLLEGLERDDVTQWPSGIFRRAYIRAYAHAIGLGPDTIVREFLEAHPDPEEVMAAAAAAQAAERAEASASGARLRHIMGSALGSLSRLRRSSPVSEPAFSGAAPEDVPAPRHEPARELSRSDAVAGEDSPDTVGSRTADAQPPVSVSLPAAAEPLVAVAEAVPEDGASLPGVGDAPTAPAAEAPVVPDSIPAPARVVPDYLAIAQLCTEFARVGSPDQAQALLVHAARILDAAGIIVWIGDNVAEELRPALSYGYSPRVLAQLPAVQMNDDNVTAAAFRTAQPRAVTGGADSSGALAIPLPTPEGCAGVLAIELHHGGEQAPSVRAAAVILAALLGQLVGDRGTRYTEPEVPAVPVAVAIPFRAVSERRAGTQRR